MSSPHDRNEPSFTATIVAPEASVYDDEPPPRSKPRNRRRKLAGAVVAVAALTGFAGIAWYATSESRRDPATVVPVIAADADPIKERPQDPGGLDIPNRGMEVFSRITPGKEPQKVERLLPPAETPVARPAPEAARPPSGPLVPDAPAIKEREAMPASTVTPSGPSPAAAAEEEKPAREVTKAPVAAAVVPPKEAPKRAAQPAPPPAPKAAALAGGGWQVQLGASRQQAGANAAVKRLAAANKDLLGPLTTSVVRADLGAKGTYYRMRAGPLKDRTAAEELCRKLKARKVGCMVIKP